MDNQPGAPVTPLTNPIPTAAPAPPPTAVAPAPVNPSNPIPDIWPGAFKIYKHSKQVVMSNVWTLVVLYLITVAISILANAILKKAGEPVGLLIGSLMGVAYVLVFLAAIRGEKLSIGDAIKHALPFWLRAIGLTILTTLTLVVSFLLLIVPFFIVYPRLVLASYFLVDQKMGVIEAYKASWAATKGHAGKVWGIIGASIAMSLLMITIIGIPVAIYFLIMYSAAYAILYKFITQSTVPAPAAPVSQQVPAPAPVASPAPVTPPAAPVQTETPTVTPPTTPPAAPPAA